MKYFIEVSGKIMGEGWPCFDKCFLDYSVNEEKGLTMISLRDTVEPIPSQMEYTEDWDDVKAQLPNPEQISLDPPGGHMFFNNELGIWSRLEESTHPEV